MAPAPPPRRGPSLAWPFAAAALALIFYASLHPFTGWQWPGDAGWRLMWLPWPHYWSRLDIVANVVGYLPLGFFLALAWSSRRPRRDLVWLATVGCGALLSWTLEVLQQALPVRVPSLVDWLLNVAGQALGAGVALSLRRFGVVDWLRGKGEGWIDVDDGGMALALLVAWPMALLFPVAVPLGLGQVLARVRASLAAWVDGSGLEAWIPAPELLPLAPVQPLVQLLITALGLLAPALLAATVVRRPLLRVLLACGAAALGLGITSLSTALTVGLEQAFTWIRPTTPHAFALAALGVLLVLPLSRRSVAVIGLVLVTAWIALVNQSPSDPYFEANLQSWELGRYQRFHGLAQWIGWVWPFAAVLVLGVRAAWRRRPPRAPS